MYNADCGLWDFPDHCCCGCAGVRDVASKGSGSLRERLGESGEGKISYVVLAARGNILSECEG